jgi:hypothetical protein
MCHNTESKTNDDVKVLTTTKVISFEKERERRGKKEKVV